MLMESLTAQSSQLTINKTLIIIVGPTAVGKTDLCVRLAQTLDTEIVSADSRQFYQELSIGTAKPTPTEMQGIRHHFVDSHHITDYFSVGDYERACLDTLDNIFSCKDVAILTGGSGLFIKVITDGIDDMPEAPLALREELMQYLEKEGITPLKAQLQSLDPDYFATMDTLNTQRILRALEVCLATGKPYSSFRKNTQVERPFNMLKIGLERPREQLYARIDTRMDTMLQAGLVQEAQNLLPFREHYALKTVGYKEIFEYLDGLYDEKEMIRLLKRNSRRYAKRQMTWFKNQDDFRWFQADDYEQIEEYVLDFLKNISKK